MAESNAHYFYVLKTKDNTLYGGYTVNPILRLKQHNQGIGAKYTRLEKRRPVAMVHLELFETRSQAMKAEYAFKHLGSRARKNAYLNKHSKNAQMLLSHIFKDG